ncbi:MAG: AmmeMemoRadiSam system protein B [Phycisphaerae bacterium]|nr:AmmeMemoRadiSam system protein B [Phycisphaerae bacterium]
MRVREPVVAGQFYPADPERCRADVDALLQAVAAAETASPDQDPVGGLVPHAGWMYSGALAAAVLARLAFNRQPQVVVLFGGVHRSRGRQAAMFGDGRWETPLGPAIVDARLAERVLGHSNLILDDPYAHEDEHSIEVQMPLVVRLFPEARVLPIMVPPIADAHEVGEAVARTLTAYRYDAVVVGTTDLTHYGPAYGFTPRGVGLKARAWAKDENDRRFISLVCDMQDREVVGEAAAHRNACSSGATAATIAACRKLGAESGRLLHHTTSAEITLAKFGSQAEDSVGYAGILFA